MIARSIRVDDVEQDLVDVLIKAAKYKCGPVLYVGHATRTQATVG